MRLPILIAAAAFALWGQDAREIVRKAIELDRRNADLQSSYTYLQREETRELDGAGKDKRLSIRTVEISMIDGSPYRRLVARNDRPIPAEEQKQEEEKLRFNRESRGAQTPAERERRIAEWRRREEKRREPLYEVADAYNFKLAGEETNGGVPCWVIEATPKPGYKPKSSTAAVLTVLAGRIWVSKSDYGWVKTDMESRDAVSIGGFLLRLSKGSRISIEQTAAGGAWLPKAVEIQFSARVLLFKGVRESLKFGFSDYRKPAPPAGSGAAER